MTTTTWQRPRRRCCWPAGPDGGGLVISQPGMSAATCSKWVLFRSSSLACLPARSCGSPSLPGFPLTGCRSRAEIRVMPKRAC
jgi:hypothetical protein